MLHLGIALLKILQGLKFKVPSLCHRHTWVCPCLLLPGQIPHASQKHHRLPLPCSPGKSPSLPTGWGLQFLYLPLSLWRIHPLSLWRIHPQVATWLFFSFFFKQRKLYLTLFFFFFLATSIIMVMNLPYRETNNYTSVLAKSRLTGPFAEGMKFRHNECAGCRCRNVSLADQVLNKGGRVLRVHGFSSLWVIMSGQCLALKCVTATNPCPSYWQRLWLKSWSKTKQVSLLTPSRHTSCDSLVILALLDTDRRYWAVCLLSLSRSLLILAN